MSEGWAGGVGGGGLDRGKGEVKLDTLLLRRVVLALTQRLCKALDNGGGGDGASGGLRQEGEGCRRVWGCLVGALHMSAYLVCAMKSDNETLRLKVQGAGGGGEGGQRGGGGEEFQATV